VKLEKKKERKDSCWILPAIEMGAAYCLIITLAFKPIAM
jgi:hypothetical protein